MANLAGLPLQGLSDSNSVTQHYLTGRGAGMLSHMNSLPQKGGVPSNLKQRGVVLIVSLVILVALTIAGIALVRSVDTTSLVAGNLAFQQSASHSGEAGIEGAIRTYLETQSREDLSADHFDRGYTASTPAAGNPVNWDAYWNTTVNPNPLSFPVTISDPNQLANCTSGVSGLRPGRSCTLRTDAAGNTVTYHIQRLCQNAGDPLLSPTGCASGSQLASLSGGSLGSGSSQLPQVTQYYYRITARVDGPRNTLTYLQMIIAR